MDKIDMQSALKSGAIAAGVAIVINVLGLIPFIGGLFRFISICGGIFIPIAGGMLYGYFAEGKEDTQTGFECVFHKDGWEWLELKLARKKFWIIGSGMAERYHQRGNHYHVAAN